MLWQRLSVTSSISVAESDISPFTFLYLLQIVISLIFLLSPPPWGRLEGGLPLVVPDAAGFAGVGITATTAAVIDVLCTIEAFHIALADDAVVLQAHHCH